MFDCISSTDIACNGPIFDLKGLKMGCQGLEHPTVASLVQEIGPEDSDLGLKSVYVVYTTHFLLCIAPLVQMLQGIQGCQDGLELQPSHRMQNSRELRGARGTIRGFFRNLGSFGIFT